MPNIDGPSNVDIQLAMAASSRRNYYTIAKWFNFFTLFIAIILFIVFVVDAAQAAKALEGTSGKTSQAVSLFTFLALLMLADVGVSAWFWWATGQAIATIGTSREVSHTALGICDLIFANWISGILILIASSSFNQSQVLMTLREQYSQQYSE